ncbi:hypothetical protein GMA19_02130 [Paenibacillus polymyxa E681]|uniref:hypothetical protein n=1 Tax=Paenibacillus polymyxa TaxID=1406 RepID=UPI0001E32057|nr:hypothetical protein [Paenibacillus polymyxa]ADM69941.1 hypothetical protein PPE_02105 [Paenibacillus polymyxa E681]QNV56966.1 hypothetical protein GE561_02130 [Paenibacillus polymyxa E681]QNV61803.1 hypothetical protein GMA19_02130 [Paenibacillus polymyxa E681]
MGKQFLKIAAVYFALSVLLSVIIGVSGDYSLSNVQSHIHLLGWTALGIIGLIYVAFPALSVPILARIHFWMHNIGLPVLILAIIVKNYEVPEAEVWIIIGWVLLAAGIMLFMVNVWDRLR